ncbi:MAG: hypothetical protein ACFFFT_14795 [Candidatus Thorarchaeota archaeon]
MAKRGKFYLFLTSFLLFIVILSYMVEDSEIQYTDYNNDLGKTPEASASVEGIENVIVTKVDREAKLNSYGLLIFEDSIDIQNLNNFPISSIFFGLPAYNPENLVFFKAIGTNENTLLAERSSIIMNGWEMIVIYFNSPLLPHQTRSIEFTYIFNNIMSFTFLDKQYVNTLVTVYPILPYKIQGDITAYFGVPQEAADVEGEWGTPIVEVNKLLYAFDDVRTILGIDYITPFLENLEDKSVVQITFTIEENTKAEIKEIKRDIFISPWGIIRVNEKYLLKNLGVINFYTVTMKIPKHASNLYVFDDLGELPAEVVESLGNTKYKEISISNRFNIVPNSTFSFNIEYNLPFEKYVSFDWFQESIQIDLLSTIYDYMGRDQTIKVIIDGCYNIDSISEYPDAIKKTRGTTVLVYKSDFVLPLESMVIQFTFTIDLFDLLLRPIIFMLIISIIASIYVLTVKVRKKERDVIILKREFIPVNEIREFCSLYEEKNALTLEIRQAEEDTRRKKIAKKNYKNILDKNTSKIEEIQQEINPFKKILLETNVTFENVIKRLDLLEAERISVKDSLNLLESRYKRGRLPSRAAYLKLSDDFKKRRRKIERNIDKLIQQLRSYLL